MAVAAMAEVVRNLMSCCLRWVWLTILFSVLNVLDLSAFWLVLESLVGSILGEFLF